VQNGHTTPPIDLLANYTRIGCIMQPGNKP
jgi:hypothetical protein